MLELASCLLRNFLQRWLMRVFYIGHERVESIFAFNPGFGNGPVAGARDAFAMTESTMQPPLAALFCALYGARTHCRSTSAAFGNDQG
ncbi:hypothetical protein MPLSOD_80169 [Mesorhizobium sp. SOD10]|nr:hypothetical protein MPLSOD_80169 [Mesorhizobium sp. SOD10]